MRGEEDPLIQGDLDTEQPVILRKKECKDVRIVRTASPLFA